MFELLGKWLINLFRLLFVRGLPSFGGALIHNRKYLRGVFVFITFLLLSYSSIQESIAQKNPLIFLEKLGGFMFNIGRELHDALQHIIEDNKFTFANVTTAIGAAYVYYVFIKVALWATGTIFGEGFPAIVYVPFGLIAFFGVLPLIFGLIRQSYFGEPLVLPFTEFVTLYHLFFTTDLIIAPVQRYLE